MRQVRLEQARQAGIEAHHAERPIIPGQQLAKRRYPPPDIVRHFDFEQQWNPTVDEHEQAFEGRDRALPDAKPRQIVAARSADDERAAADSPGVRIVENDYVPVRGQPEIALNSGAKLQRSGEGEQAVLGEAGAIVEAAVRKPLGARVERIRP